jgi:hypothetical protein
VVVPNLAASENQQAASERSAVAVVSSASASPMSGTESNINRPPTAAPVYQLHVERSVEPLPQEAPSTVAVVPGATANGFGCAAALDYLAAHAAPGFTFQCPGNASGHQAMTCVNHAPQCPGQRIIAIQVPCPAAYENEASNSWVLLGLRSAAIDPYGYCH